MKKTRNSGWVNRAIMTISLLAFSWSFVAGASAATDISGSKDLSFLQRFPNSWIVDYSQQSVPEYRLATGKMKKVNGVISPRSERYLSGLLTRVTYRLPSGRSSHEAFEHFAAQFESLAPQRLYRCKGRNCGDSDQWANYQFDIQRLYGIDREQYYQALIFDSPQGPLYLAFYTVKRGNKRVFVQLDLIDPNGVGSAPSRSQSVALTALLDQLQQKQRVYIINSEEDKVEQLLSLIQQNQALRLQLVGHSDQGSDRAQRRQHSVELAMELQQRLLNSGIGVERIEVYGVGALAPSYQPNVPSQRVEVLLLPSP